MLQTRLARPSQNPQISQAAGLGHARHAYPLVVPTENQPETDPRADATLLLGRLEAGDPDAASALLPIVYAELRARAGAYFGGQPADHTLQPTALVHEAYVKLVASPSSGWNSRAHFCAVAATAMRQILIDHARRRALAQGARRERAEVATAIVTPGGAGDVDLLALEDVLEKLAVLDERQARLVELRFFGGLSNAEVADLMDVSSRTIEREWRRVRAWLVHALGEDRASEQV